MVAELDETIKEFSEVNRIRCFLHIVNLIAKSLLKQFDVWVKEADADADADEATIDMNEQLQEFAHDFGLEEGLTQSFKGGDEDDDDDDGMVDAAELFSAHEKADFEADVRPVQLVLAKVSICEI